ncbi:hypothetical protein LPJCHP_LPJCHP_15980, partial [Dysosmobacter welbionis]
GERPEDRVLPGPEVQPPGGGAHRPGQDGAGLLHPHRILRSERRDGRGEARHRRGCVGVRRGDGPGQRGAQRPHRR